MDKTTPDRLPRALVLSFTGIGSTNATGHLLDSMFRHWPEHSLLQVYWAHRPARGQLSYDYRSVSLKDIESAIDAFQPEIIYFRPAGSNPKYHSDMADLIERLDAPVLVHSMDDWTFKFEQPLLDKLDRTVRQATANLAICKEMVEAYQQQFDTQFTALANGIDLATWSDLPGPAGGGPFVIRYCGALASDMQRDSVADVVESVKRLHRSDRPIHLELYTMPWFQEEGEAIAGGADCISVYPLVASDDYPALLATADATLLCYNFDDLSRHNTRLSFANKTPECLASGTPVLAYGPEATPSIGYISRHGLGACVLERDADQLDEKIDWLAGRPEDSRALGEHGRSWAIEHLNVVDMRRTFEDIMKQSSTRQPMTMASFTRDDDITVDETAVAYAYLRDRVAGSSSPTMIDVGAHHGSAFGQFLEDGWRVHAFEPDPNNRAYIQKRWPSHAALTLNEFAVGNVSGEKLEFYAAEQSTGISSLIPFHDDHKVVATVETVRLDDYLRDTDVSAVDFLKIDTEGFDLRVLEGFPWDDLRPAVVECEYEDAKTLNIGYDYRDLAQFLIDRDYRVFMSEWHPIIRYGIRHQWCRVVEFPAEQLSDASWGNFLAFRDSVEVEEVQALFLANAHAKNPKLAQAATPTTAPATETEDAAGDANGTAPQITPPQPKPTAAEIKPMPATNPIANHLRIFRRFVFGSQGVISIILLLLAVLAPVASSIAAQAAPLPWLVFIGPAISVLAVLHLLAYNAERARHDAELQLQSARPSDALTGRVSALSQELKALQQNLQDQVSAAAQQANAQSKKLETDITEVGRQLSGIEETQRDNLAKTERLQEQTLDLKRKLPEVLRLVKDINRELEAER